MSKQKRNNDRVAVTEDFEQLQNVVRYERRSPPSPDICDSPTRKITVNQEWAKHIFGAISTLGLWKAWTGEQDERNPAVQQVMRLLSGECEMPDWTCDDTADCIDFHSETRLALLRWHAQFGIGGPGNPDGPLPPDVTGGDMTPDGFQCDDDHRFGTALGIAEYINTVTTEVFQAIEVITNPIELSAEIIDNMPIVSAAASALDVVAWIQDTAYDAYNLYWSDGVKDNLACEIFCKMRNNENCGISFDDIWDIYTDIPDVSPPSPLASWATWFVFWSELALDLTATNNVKIMSLLALSTIRWGGKFGQMTLGIRSFETTMQLLSDDTSSDWDTLCPSCGEYVTPMVFSQSSGSDPDTIYGAGDWELLEPWDGMYVPSIGWVHSDRFFEGSEWRRSLFIELEFTATDIDSIRIKYNCSGNDQHARVWHTEIDAANIVIDSYDEGINLVKSGPVNAVTTKIIVYIVASQAETEGGLDGAVVLKELDVSGQPPKPPEWP